MSQDIQLRHRCPHQTIEERVLLGDDRMSLQTRQPVANASSVRILVNNDFFIPQTGISSRAELTSSASGPFKITQNETNLEIQSSTQTINFGLPVGVRIPTNIIVGLINAEVRRGRSTGDLGGILATNNNGHLIISDIKTFGDASRIFVRGRSTPLLGFLQKGAKGSPIYPPWTLSSRPDPTIANLFPKFVSPIRNNPIFKTTYVTHITRCLRCQALNEENDYRFDSQGGVLLVDNENLLLQASLKIILTKKGSNRFQKFYGTELSERIGTKAVSAAAAQINQDVREALENLQTLQEDQAAYQRVSPGERLFEIVTVRTTPNELDQSAFEVEVIARNSSRRPIRVTTFFTTPGVGLIGDPTRLTPLERQNIQNLLIPPLT